MSKFCGRVLEGSKFKASGSIEPYTLPRWVYFLRRLQPRMMFTHWEES